MSAAGFKIVGAVTGLRMFRHENETMASDKIGSSHPGGESALLSPPG